MAPGKKTSPTAVDAITHSDKRVNIPTADAQEWLEPEARAPIPLRYPRDSTLDPQLVWKGKDGQDADDLVVEAPPLYIQEKVDPRVLVENLQRTAARPDEEPELALFDTFDGLQGLQSVEFYRHAANWSNRLILGDSLQVMGSLAEREQLRGQVQMIYIDPPYGINFGSNWQVSTQQRMVKDRVEDAAREVEQIKAFRDTWELGVNSYLPYLRDRLVAARDLLVESGSIFVQIGDENIHLVRCLLDEVFGAANFCGQISFRTKIPLRTTLVPMVYDHILWYARDVSQVKFRRLFRERPLGADTQFSWVEEPNGVRRKLTKAEAAAPDSVQGRIFRLTDLVSAGRTESCVFEFTMEGKTFYPGGGKSWKTNSTGMRKLIAAGRIMAPSKVPNYVFFADDYPVMEYDNVWSDTQGASDRVYVVQTSSKVVERCLLMTTDPGDLVLDPTCGSGTTAFVAEEWGRRWVTIDTSRVALTLARQRIMGAKYPHYTLLDSPSGRVREAALTGHLPDTDAPSKHDIRKGFVYRRVQHVTLGSITNNSAIHEGMTRREIDEAIAKHAEAELLYDQPYEDPNVVRVAGRSPSRPCHRTGHSTTRPRCRRRRAVPPKN